MKKLSIVEFETLLSSQDWQHTQDWEVVESKSRQIEEASEDGEYPILINIPHSWGWASKASTLGDISIVYTETFSYDDFDSDSLSASADGQDAWVFEGFVVVGEDGEELRASELPNYIPHNFSTIDYSELNIDQTTDVDVDEESEMETITIEIDGAPDIRFTGELMASVSSRGNSGETNIRWTELALYKTKSGKYICHQIGKSCWQGERDRHSGKVCETLDEVKAFFGYRWLAKELYDGAGIDAAVDVE